MEQSADKGIQATRHVASTCLSTLRDLEGEVSERAKPSVQSLQEYLARVIGQGHTDKDPLDDTEEKYLLNFTDSISLNRMPVKRGSFVYAEDLAEGGIRSRATSLSSEALDSMPLELMKIDNWDDFNIFEVDNISKGQTLQLVCMVLLEELQLLESLKLDREKMIKFLQEIERLYKHNPYHNHVHAADVVQALGVFLCVDDLKSMFTDLELLAMVLAAASHDVCHPGLTNEFHVNTHSELAITYNDRAVNENMHASQAFKSMSDPCCNVLSHLCKDDYTFVRRSMINIILATDMAAHKSLLSQFSVHVENLDKDTWSSVESRSALQQMLVHCADISNPARPWELSSRWSHKVLEELFAQGDVERALNIPCSPLCDRAQVELPKSQSTFLKYVVKPSFELLQKVAPKSSELALYHVSENIKRWENWGSDTTITPGTPPGNKCIIGVNGN